MWCQLSLSQHQNHKSCESDWNPKLCSRNQNVVIFLSKKAYEKALFAKRAASTLRKFGFCAKLSFFNSSLPLQVVFWWSHPHLLDIELWAKIESITFDNISIPKPWIHKYFRLLLVLILALPEVDNTADCAEILFFFNFFLSSQTDSGPGWGWEMWYTFLKLAELKANCRPIVFIVDDFVETESGF